MVVVVVLYYMEGKLSMVTSCTCVCVCAYVCVCVWEVCVCVCVCVCVRERERERVYETFNKGLFLSHNWSGSGMNLYRPLDPSTLGSIKPWSHQTLDQSTWLPFHHKQIESGTRFWNAVLTWTDLAVRNSFSSCNTQGLDFVRMLKTLKSHVISFLTDSRETTL